MLDTAGALAEAEARATRARARAEALRRQARAADLGDQPPAAETTVAADTPVAEPPVAEPTVADTPVADPPVADTPVAEPAVADPAAAPPRRRPRLWGPRWGRLWSRKVLVGASAIAVACASLTASGYLLEQHHKIGQQRQRAAAFSAAARTAIEAMMSLSPKTARADWQRFADDTTGQFKAMVLIGGEDVVNAVEKSKISSKGKVEKAAVQSMTNDSAVVLVAAKTELFIPGQAKPQSQSSRMVVTVEKDGGAIKVAGIEPVP